LIIRDHISQTDPLTNGAGAVESCFKWKWIADYGTLLTEFLEKRVNDLLLTSIREYFIEDILNILSYLK